jgi:hypothetical protein
MRAIILSVTISALTLLAFTPSNAEDEVRDGGREHEPQAFLTPTVTYQTIARRAGIGSPGVAAEAITARTSPLALRADY